MSLSDRLNMLQHLRVAVVICGGISEMMYNMLQCCGIESITGISADIDDVIYNPATIKIMPDYRGKTGSQNGVDNWNQV
jgi:predicted Fe-Mo cluster-binding NifX family protein